MTQAKSFRIVVVGAGLSGLSAALLLDRAGYDVTVLEARTNAGGRVRTLREPFADGLYAEAGATYVSPGHENVTRWCAHFGLELDPFPATDLVARYFVRGRHWRPLEEPEAAGLFDLTPEERALGLPGMLGKYVAAVVGEAVAGSTSRDWPPESLRRFDEMTFAEFLAAQGASPDAAALLGLGFGSVWGDGPSSYSALANLRYMMGEAMYAGPDAPRANAPWQVIRGGSDLLPRAFADALRGRIRYGSPVVRIEQDERGVRAVVRRGETTEAFTGDRIVCAIPFSTLRDVEVAPSFSPPKAKAIRELRYSSTTRVYLQARARFWNEPWHVLATDEPVGVVRHATFNQPGPRAIVEAYLFGAEGRRAAGQTEPERIRTTAAGLAPILPGLASELEGGASYSWFTDPWARGSEAWYAPGEELANFPHHATVEGRVHFAGEHTDLAAGMHGAIGSGERVAREIAGSF